MLCAPLSPAALRAYSTMASCNAEAKAEKRHVVLACVADCLNLTLDAAVAEAAGDEDAVCFPEQLMGIFSRDVSELIQWIWTAALLRFLRASAPLRR